MTGEVGVPAEHPLWATSYAPTSRDVTTLGAKTAGMMN